MADLFLWLLAAGGLLLFLWCMVGWLLIPATEKTLTVLYVKTTAQMEHDVRLWLWLRAIGVQAGVLLVTVCAQDEEVAAAARRFCRDRRDVFYCTSDELMQRIKMEQA